MRDVLLRKASRQDAARIRSLVIGGRINPYGLDWRRFIVSEDASGKVIGCVQLKPHRDGSVELASLAVDPEYWRQGVALSLIEAVIAVHAGGLYLTCRSGLGAFYQNFGFKILAEEEMHGYYRLAVWLVHIFKKLTGREEGLLVMWRDCGRAEVDRYPQLGG